MLSTVEKFLEFGEAGCFLDIGCGTGRVAKGLRDLGFEVPCPDISSKIYVYAHKKRDFLKTVHFATAKQSKRKNICSTNQAKVALLLKIRCEGTLT